MKKSTEIKGLPIFSIMDGKEAGGVRSLLINADQGMVEYLIVETLSLDFGIKAIPFEKIEGIGSYAVTIESDASIIELADTPTSHDMLKKNIQIINNKVMTKKGSLLGNVSEFYIDEFSGKILGCVLTNNQELEGKVILEKNILTYGKEVVVVVEDIIDQLVSFEDFAQAEPALVEKKNETLAPKAVVVEKPAAVEVVKPAVEVVVPVVEVNTPVVEEQEPVVEETITEPVVEEAPAVEAVEEKVAPSEVYEETLVVDTTDVAKQFEDRQALFLKGKKVTRDFIGDNGAVIVPTGTILTEEQVLQVKAMGRNKLLELSMIVTD